MEWTTVLLGLIVGAVALGIIYGVYVLMHAPTSENASKKAKHKWVIDDVVITANEVPLNFKKAPNDPLMLSCCGFCKYLSKEGKTCCTRYGVTYSGVGCVTKTICDDYELSLGE